MLSSEEHPEVRWVDGHDEIDRSDALQLGVDYRLTKDVSISPVLGVDLSTFLTEETPGANGFYNVANPKVNTLLLRGPHGAVRRPDEDRSFTSCASMKQAGSPRRVAVALLLAQRVNRRRRFIVSR
jgi:hypothetical protein